ncbi:MAG: hypothetical protein COX77_03520, partial [Candidatus Komeilibacteria bacterium CG_4_10_14_0_2_um_filter_37_10]
MKNNILIFNVGSSSLRVGLYQKDSAAKYFFSVTNINSSHPIFKSEQKSFTLSKKISHLQAWLLIKKELDFYKQSNFSLVAHRIVYGDPGDQYGAIITDTKFKKLSKYVELAPLHQGSALQIIQWFKTKMPKLKQIAFFDTTFFNQLSASEKTLPLARAIRKMGVERRGFHGLSHHNCLQQVSKQE